MTRLLAGGALLLVFAIASLTDADPDLWGHVRFGLDIVRTHQLPSDDPYSFTQDRPWVNHEWLTELQMGLAWAAAGTAGLVALKGALILATLVVVWIALRGTDFEVRLMMAGLFVIGAGRAFKTLRPQLWSILCFAILCRVLAEQHPRGRRWLPLLFLVWANLHGGWLVGLGVLGVWTIFTVAVNPRDARPWLTTAVLCGLATLCTPYGWTLWIFLWQTVGVTRDITEWRPLWTVPPIAWLPWLAAIGITLWAFRQTDRDRWARSAIVLLLAYFSLRVERVLPFLVGAAVLFAAPLVAGAVDSRRRRGASTLRIRWRADRPPLKLRRSAEASATSEARRLRPSNGSRPRHEVAVALFVAITMTVTGLWISYSSQRCIPVRGPWVADREAARFLVEGTGPGKLVVPFDWGEYAIWHMGPRLRVSMDGRRETVYSDKRLAEHDAILAGTALGLSTLEAWQPEYVWLPHESSNTRQWLEAHGYRLPVSTARSFIGVRGDVPDLRALTATAGEARRCFPH